MAYHHCRMFVCRTAGTAVAASVSSMATACKTSCVQVLDILSPLLPVGIAAEAATWLREGTQPGQPSISTELCLRLIAVQSVCAALATANGAPEAPDLVQKATAALGASGALGWARNVVMNRRMLLIVGHANRLLESLTPHVKEPWGRRALKTVAQLAKEVFAACHDDDDGKTSWQLRASLSECLAGLFDLDHSLLGSEADIDVVLQMLVALPRDNVYQVRLVACRLAQVLLSKYTNNKVSPFQCLHLSLLNGKQGKNEN
jgi:hypothetical protein